MKKIAIGIFLVSLCIACQDSNKQHITVLNSADYNVYLDSDQVTYENAKKNNEFWLKRLAPDSSGVGDLGPLAGTYTDLFVATGKVSNLKNVEALYKKAINISATNKDSYTRSLAQNYMSQHRFKEAQELLETIYAGHTNKRVTELQLFDVYMERGMYDKAFENLQKVKNTGDYHYLIRLAKWSDYRGDLDLAIKYLEQALAIAESGGLKPLKIWTYTNLGDFYGHAGRINDAYNMYLKTLALQPDNAYAKKGIAWIAYAYEKDTEEANRILDKILEHHNMPDYFLFKAEIAEYKGDIETMEKNLKLFETTVSDSNYGMMYNTYFVEYFAERNPKKALEIARQEVINRATPETFHLLALAQLNNGLKSEALTTIQRFVAGKTSKPKALFHSALVYKANGMDDLVKEISETLKDASFQIGPLLSKKVQSL
ncbi:TPR repeat [unidentified eubacterium SCB49]|nr:TPR repeat [unidentified eubacterium SCB49]